MDRSTSRFDAWTRRQFGLAAGGLAAALLGIAPGTDTDARKKKRKKKKPQVNTFGCLDVGKACSGNDALCCSGVCQGKKPKKGKKDTSRCIAHNALDCQAGANSCAGGTVPCGTAGACVVTTGTASFCSATGDGDCVACQTDADCEASRGPGAACIVCPGNCPDTTTACFAAGV
jgi:hypothetical protein